PVRLRHLISRPTRAGVGNQRAEDRHTAFSGCLGPYRGLIRFNAATPCSCLNGCHPRPVNASVARRRCSSPFARKGTRLTKVGRGILGHLVPHGNNHWRGGRLLGLLTEPSSMRRVGWAKW